MLSVITTISNLVVIFELQENLSLWTFLLNGILVKNMTLLLLKLLGHV